VVREYNDTIQNQNAVMLVTALVCHPVDSKRMLLEYLEGNVTGIYEVLIGLGTG
jgi:hypothetical protein